MNNKRKLSACSNDDISPNEFVNKDCISSLSKKSKVAQALDPNLVSGTETNYENVNKSLQYPSKTGVEPPSLESLPPSNSTASENKEIKKEIF